MIVLLIVAIAAGLLAASALWSVGWLAVLIGSPFVASFAAILAGCLMAWQTTRRDRQKRALDAQTGLMVAALRDVTRKAEPQSPAPKVSRRRLGA
ncbi:hypothetical protein MKK88_20640 [Methylobacterium sp. E-005]|uniref:hypothetical protein n=1 Tax=Methylobacterium sp. E-005 TaxID=2836549 RepID=UPI001FBB7B2E|nr:hypothetical protein [Methylobacterium sp. E-005]MCJ2088375.1 hypothetical protein [Methylobacterium sp. E-005]